MGISIGTHSHTCEKIYTQMACWTACVLQCGCRSVKISRFASSRPSFHYCSSSLPDAYNPITFCRSAPARASLDRHTHIDSTSEPANRGQTQEDTDSQPHNRYGGKSSKQILVLSTKFCSQRPHDNFNEECLKVIEKEHVGGYVFKQQYNTIQ